MVILASLLIAALAEPLPPLLDMARSDFWTRIGEWIGLSLLGLVVLSLMGVTDMELDLSLTGIRIRPASVPKEQVGEVSAAVTEELARQLAEMRQDNLALQQMAQRQREELLLGAGTQPDQVSEDDNA